MKRTDCKIRLHRFYIQHSCRRIYPCRLENIICLSDRQRHPLHIIQRETAYIYLPALGIGDRYAIIADSRMLCSEATYGNCFQPSYSTVILNGSTGEMCYCFRQIMQPQPIETGLYPEKRDAGR